MKIRTLSIALVVMADALLVAAFLGFMFQNYYQAGVSAAIAALLWHVAFEFAKDGVIETESVELSDRSKR
jgi:hypothetical protein